VREKKVDLGDGALRNWDKNFETLNYRFSPAAGLKSLPAWQGGQFNRIETLQFCIDCFWIVRAVFNRDYPFNRGCPSLKAAGCKQKPRPPTTNFNLNDIGFHVVSYERYSNEKIEGVGH